MLPLEYQQWSVKDISSSDQVVQIKVCKERGVRWLFFGVYEILQIANWGDLWQNLKFLREYYDAFGVCWEISIQFSSHMSVRKSTLLPTIKMLWISNLPFSIVICLMQVSEGAYLLRSVVNFRRGWTMDYSTCIGVWFINRELFTSCLVLNLTISPFFVL